MRQCPNCGSCAINAHIGDPERRLCDVCYWREQAAEARAAAKRIVEFLPSNELMAWAVDQWPWLEQEEQVQ